MTSAPSAASARRLRVALLHQAPEAWCNVRSVWDALARDADIDARLVLLPVLQADLPWDREAAERPLREESVPWQAWDAFDPGDAGFDAVLFTSPHDDGLPPAYRFAELSPRVRFAGYLPDRLDVGEPRPGPHDPYGHPAAKDATAVYVHSAGARAMYARHCPGGDAHVVVSGHPRMDGLVDLERFPVDPGLRSEIGDRTAVLWTPHASFESDLWSSFDFMAAPILRQFAQRPDLALLFRPPALFWRKLMALGMFDQTGIAALRAELRDRGVVVDERPDHRHAFAASAAMMADADSSLLEYFVTGKPVLYLRNPHGPGLNAEGRAVARHYDTAGDVEDVARFLDGLRHRPAQERDLRRAAIPLFFAGFDGGAGARVVAHMKRALGA